MSNIEYLASLLNIVGQNDWSVPLLRVLRSSDAEEIHGNPQLNRVSFILARAKMRRRSSIKLGLETFGLQSLIVELEKLAADEQLETYGLGTASYSGSCFVLNGRMVGCEFVKRGMSKTFPFDGN